MHTYKVDKFIEVIIKKKKIDAKHHLIQYTVNFLNIRTPKKIVVITLKFELCGSTIE